MSVLPSLGGIFIVHLIPWSVPWQWAPSNRKQFSSCPQSAPSFFPSPGVFSLGCNFFTRKLPGVWEKQISSLHCLWLCSVQLWCFHLGPSIPGLFWGIIGCYQLWRGRKGQRAGRVHCHFSRGQGKCCRGQDVMGCVAVGVCEGGFKTNMK